MATFTAGYNWVSGETVTPAKLISTGTPTISNIANADVASNAAIAGTKIAPDFGAQAIATTGNATLGNTVSVGLASTSAAQIDVGAGATGNRAAVVDFVGDTTYSDYGLRVGRPLSDGANGTSVVEHRGTGPLIIRAVEAGTIRFSTSNAERARMDSLGNFLFGHTSSTTPGITNSNVGATMLQGGTGPALIISRSTDCPYWANRNDDGAAMTFLHGGSGVGSVSVTATATAFNTSSDYRLKENASPMVGALEVLSQTKPCLFTWKADGSAGSGFIAHELQSVVPEAVTGEKDAADADGNPRYQGVDASKLVPYLVSAVKELKARVETLEAAE
jgi:hypothetical protein